MIRHTVVFTLIVTICLSIRDDVLEEYWTYFISYETGDCFNMHKINVYSRTSTSQRIDGKNVSYD
jgi:hypothetical protein